MPHKQLGEPLWEGGIRSSNFFNGRLLTAEDLKSEQEAQRAYRVQLGQALGPGITRGLDVRLISPGSSTEDGVVRISAGLAISRAGSLLRLASDTDLAVMPAPAPGPGMGSFRTITPESPGAVRLAALVLSPATKGEGQAPMVGPGTGGALSGTNFRSIVDAVQFRLISLPVPEGCTSPGTLRNQLAHLCFGTPARLRFPGAAVPEPPGLAALAPGGAWPETDVPLCLVCMIDGRIRWIDAWSVRADRTPDAMFRQFQSHLDDLCAEHTDMSTVNVFDYFRYLPPVGSIPTGTRLLKPDWFFRPLMTERIEVDPAFVEPWTDPVRKAAPIDLSAPPPLWLYQPEGANYAVFVRREQPRSVTYANTGNVLVDVTLPERQELLETAGIEVFSADREGLRQSAEPLGHSFVLRNLVPGTYTIWATARNYRAVSQRVRIPAGASVPIQLRLGRAVRTPPDVSAPNVKNDASWYRPGAYDQLVIKPDTLTNAELPEAMLTWLDMGTPPSPVAAWLKGWAGWFSADQPGMPIDPDQIQLLIDPLHTPEHPQPAPYAVVVFGKGGAFCQMELVAAAKPPAPPAPQEPVGILEPGAAGVAAGSMPEPAPAPPKKRGPIRRLLSWIAGLFVETTTDAAR